MKLENQVTNLEISKRLRELDVKQESLFYWVERTYEPGLVGNNPCVNLVTGEDINFSRYHRVSDELLASAFTCAELGEMLPWTFIAKRTSKFPETEMFLMMSKDDSMGQKSFSIWYEGMYDDGEEFKWESIIEQNEAEARGKMLIYLIENGLCPSPSKT